MTRRSLGESIPMTRRAAFEVSVSGGAAGIDKCLKVGGIVANG